MTKFTKTILQLSLLALSSQSVLALSWFKTPHTKPKEPQFNIPRHYSFAKPETSENAANINWRDFFADPYLNDLIDTALINNQEINIFLQDIEIAKNEVKEKQGEYLPKVGLGFGGGTSRVSENSRDGVIDKIIDRNEIRSPNLDLNLGLNMIWELDIWKKLRNAKDAAKMRVMAKNEGQNYIVSRLVAEIARNYYELMALDNSLKILDENIKIQDEAFQKMKALKEYAKSNQLAVNRFEAQLLKTKNQRFEISQQIVENENRLKFLTGIYENGPIRRNSDKLMSMQVNPLQVGVPSQLLENRPDIRQAEYSIKAAKLDLKSVKANLYPSLGIRAGLGFSVFDPALLFNPQSLIYNFAGDLIAPLINRKAIIARINMANAYQIQTVLNYEQTLLQAYTEVLNQMSRIKNAQQSLETKQKEVNILNDSVGIANSLFKYAKANYVEVLLTQEEKVNAQMELVEAKKNLIESKIDLYRALGGGWR